MIVSTQHKWILLGIVILLPILAWIHLTAGIISIETGTIFDAIFSYDDNNTLHVITREIRIPRMTMAIIAGAGLSIAGLLMQTLFNNPLAGPYVLGINSGASLFVAFSIMTGIPFLTSDLGIVTNALIGAFIFGLIIVLFSELIRSQISLLLVGLMLGSFTSAIVSMLQTVSGAEELKVFTLWALGSLMRVDSAQLPLIVLIFSIGLAMTFLLVKPLNVLVMGQKQAQLMGIHYRRVRILIIFVTALLTGLITAFCGPIAFVGLAVPNLLKLLMKTQNHGVLLIAAALFGGAFVLACDIIIQLMENSFMVPINVFTSIIGAPIVVLLVLRRLR